MWYESPLFLNAIVVPYMQLIDFTKISLNLSLLLIHITGRNAHFSVHFDFSFGKFMRKEVSKGRVPASEGVKPAD